MKKFGFTLAEVLVTLGLLGVVAALTLPSLNTNISNTTLEKQTLKFYTQLQKAVDLYKAENDDDFDVNTFDGDAFVKRYLKISTVCNSNFTNCLGSDYSVFNHYGTAALNNDRWIENATYMLDDGAVFSVFNDADHSAVRFFVDVNGRKGPNRVGFDIWSMYVDRSGGIDDAGLTTRVKRTLTPQALQSRIDGLRRQCGTDYVGCFSGFLRNGYHVELQNPYDTSSNNDDEE